MGVSDQPNSRGSAGPPPPRSIVVMGPSGCGKSTLGEALAAALGWRFIEGDEHHPRGNRAKMAGGEPLSEADRLPFLQSVARALASGGPAVASCSALRKAHRDLLRKAAGEILFVLPLAAPEELARRMTARPAHFMPAALLASQLAALEPPSAGERFLQLDATDTVAEQVAAVLGHLKG